MARTLGLFIALGALVTACASVPKSESKRLKLQEDAQVALQQMQADDPSLRSLMDQAYGYVVFPDVKQGGFIVGGAGGEGVVYQGGRMVGYAELSQASVGAQVGGQAYSQVIVMRDANAYNTVRYGKLDFGAQASATIVKAGAATATRFGDNGVAVLIHPKGGAMVDASISGQNIKFKF